MVGEGGGSGRLGHGRRRGGGRAAEGTGVDGITAGCDCKFKFRWENYLSRMV